MEYIYDACDQISDFCNQQLLRKMRRKISWMDGWTDGRTDGRTDRGKTVYPPPPSGSGGIKITPPKTPNSFHIHYRTLLHFYFNQSLGHMIFLLIYFRFGSHIVEDFEVPQYLFILLPLTLPNFGSILIKLVFSDHLYSVVLFQCSLDRSHKTGHIKQA